MKKLYAQTFLLAAFAATGTLKAAIIPCANTTISVLIAMGSGSTNGCQIDDKLFNGFSYTPLAGAPTSAQVVSNLVANLGTRTYGWTFGSSTGSFGGDFTLGYTVTVLTSGTGSCPLCLITSDQEQIFAGNAPPTALSISVAESAGTTPIVVSNASFANNTNGAAFAGVLSLTKLATSSGITAGNPLLTFESDVRQTQGTVVPEPATLSLMGISILGLGLIRRRNARKA